MQQDYNPSQTRVITVRSSPEHILAVVEARLREVEWVNDARIEREGNTVSTVAKMTKQWARVAVSACGRKDGAVDVVIESRPRWNPGVIADYGRGIENVEELRRALAQWIPA